MTRKESIGRIVRTIDLTTVNVTYVTPTDEVSTQEFQLACKPKASRQSIIKDIKQNYMHEFPAGAQILHVSVLGCLSSTYAMDIWDFMRYGKIVEGDIPDAPADE